MFIEETNGKKLFDLQVEKDDLQRAIDFQRNEQERIKRITHKKDFEFELMKMRTAQEERRRLEEIQIEGLSQKVDNERRNMYFNEELLRSKEEDLREKEQFQQLMQDTEE